MLFFHAAHHYAEVASFNHHAHAQGLDGALYGLGNLDSEPLLHLQAARKSIHQPGNFAQTDDLAAGNVGYVNLTEKREHVVLAQAEHLDILDDYHLVIGHIEHSALEQFVWILAVALGQVLQAFLHALRSSEQAIALRIFTYSDQQFAQQLGGCGRGQADLFVKFLHSFSWDWRR